MNLWKERILVSTIPHNDAQNGYSLRIGKNLPAHAANLAYVHTDSPEPSKNLSVINKANEVPENREKEPDIFHQLYSTKISNTEVDNDNQITLDNIIKNGDFRDGETGWGVTRGNLQTDSSTVFFTPTEGASRISRQNDVNIEHVYYHSMRVKATGSTPHIYPTNPIGSSQSIGGTGEWETVSVIHKPTVNSTEIRYVYNGAIGIPIEIDWILRIDLTQTFGAGNEPSKEYMDNIIRQTGYFEDITLTIHQDSDVFEPEIFTDVLYQDGKPFVVPNENVLLTNQYTNDNNQLPLYYISSLAQDVNLGNQEVLLYVNGRKTGSRMTYNRIQVGQVFVYESNQLKVTKNNSQPLDYNEHFKVIGVPTGRPNIARLYVLTNFENSMETSYSVEYSSFQDNKVKNIRETLNPRRLFVESTGTPSENEFMRYYKLISTNKKSGATSHIPGYYIQMRADNQVEETDINAFNRNPYQFNYQIQADIETRFSDRNPVTVNIGYIYINESVINVFPLTSALKTFIHSGLFPSYVKFQNPHHGAGEPYPESVNYWLANLEMPEEHYLDYDILIIAGYGQKDLTHYSENLSSFLDAGGLLLVDNNEVEHSLDFFSDEGEQTFIVDVRFSQEESLTNKLFFKDDEFNNRYYNHPQTTGIGHNFAQIDFLNSMSQDDWEVIIEHENNQAALAYYMFRSGKIFLSNIGFMTDIILGNQETQKILVNLFIYYLEHRSFKTPIFKDYVLHKDDLFPEDYTDKEGNTVYFNDSSDQDSTQVIAKKVIGGRTADIVNPYLPVAYQSPIRSEYHIHLQDSVIVELENGNFERYSEKTVFEDTTASAIPGFRYVLNSKGTKSAGGLSSMVRYSGTQSLYVDFMETRGYFEQELLDLQPGNYKISTYVKTDNVTGGGLSIYDGNLNEIASNETLDGTSVWKTHTLYFTLDNAETVYLRLGSSTKAMTGRIYFDDVVLSNQGNIRMTPSNHGELELYAYALEPQGQNYMLGYQNNGNVNVVKNELTITPTVRIRSFVYEWDSSRLQYQKHYGKTNYVKLEISYSEGEKVIGRLIDFIPGNEAGFQWNYAQNIYYQIEIDGSDIHFPYVNLSIYDPSIGIYYYASNGQWIINREDLWWNGIDSTVQLRARSMVDNLKVTGSQYSAIQLNNNQIKLVEPNTNEEQDRWYPRIKNGAFSRELLNQSDMEQLKLLGMENYYDEYIVGRHQYAIPEYHRQSFYPRKGERLIEKELASYINPNTIQVQKYPMVIKEQNMETPLYNFDGDKHTYRSLDVFWDSRYPVEVYQDDQRIYDGYDINFEEGYIRFDREVPNTAYVFAKYRQNNVRVFRRKLSNSRIDNERLERVDDNTMRLSHEQIAVSPSPTFYRDGQAIHPAEYWVDYEAGLLNFYQSNNKNIYASYSYYIYEELEHTNINAIRGEIEVSNTLHFLDEIIVDYVYKEDYLEYKGYYDRDNNIFVHIDLNPTAGHTFTAKKYDPSGKFLHYYEEASERLLNKTVYFYLLPQYSQYINRFYQETETVRHCLSEKEWKYVKSVNPEAILLGTIHVRENTDIDNITMLDARRLGGGLKETVSDESIQKRVGYTSAFWDIGDFDGLSYYRNGTTVIQLPNTILKSNGGDFSEDDINGIISRYLALGVYPVIEYVPVNNVFEDNAGDVEQ